jgi:chorismate mutase
MISAIEEAKSQGDSLGGIIEAQILNPPPGLGDPVFGKLDAELSRALMSIGSVKGIEFGDGFAAAHMKGSEFNDPISPNGLTTNHAGGILGGISTGDPIVLRIVVKPTSSISRDQQTIDRTGKPQTIHIRGRHDPCICPRIVPVVEAMIALVLLDRYHYQLILRSKQNSSTRKIPLAKLRQRVDFIDAQLLALIADRQYWVRQIKEEKLLRTGKKVLTPKDITDPKREKFQLNRIKKISNDLGIDGQDALNVFKSIFKLSKNAQRHKK